jgi:cystathionine beta-synthase
MSTSGISEVPVIDEADCVGSLSEGPLMAKALEDSRVLERPVSEVMQPPFPVVDEHLPLEKLSAFLSRNTPAVVVRRNGKLAGIVTRYDVLRQVAGVR